MSKIGAIVSDLNSNMKNLNIEVHEATGNVKLRMDTLQCNLRELVDDTLSNADRTQ